MDNEQLDNLPVIPDTFKAYLEMTQPTLTSRIFELSAPYNNPYQGSRKRILFVCSAGLLRSPTGAHVGSVRGYNTRSCGSSNYALIPLSANLIEWASKIVFVNEANFHEAVEAFRSAGWDRDIEDKAVVLNIPDSYEAFDPKLVEMFNEFFDVAEACDWRFPDTQ